MKIIKNGIEFPEEIVFKCTVCQTQFTNSRTETPLSKVVRYNNAIDLTYSHICPNCFWEIDSHYWIDREHNLMNKCS